MNSLHACYEAGQTAALDKIASSALGKHFAKLVGGKGATPKSLSKIRGSKANNESYSYQDGI